MSTRRERQRKLYQSVRTVISQKPQRVPHDGGSDRSSRQNVQMRTISGRTLKIVAIVLIVLLLLFLISPKPATPPGQSVQGANTSLSPIDLKNIQTSIPPVNGIQGENFGKTLKDTLEGK